MYISRFNNLLGIYIIAIIMAVMVFSSGMVFANTNLYKQIIEVYTGVNMEINGKAVFPTDANGKPVDVHIWKGTTYVPIRFVAEYLDKDVSWDQKTHTVSINDRDWVSPSQPQSDQTYQNYLEYDGKKKDFDFVYLEGDKTNTPYITINDARKLNSNIHYSSKYNIIYKGAYKSQWHNQLTLYKSGQEYNNSDPKDGHPYSFIGDDNKTYLSLDVVAFLLNKNYYVYDNGRYEISGYCDYED